ncbi:hypothetical protein [Desertivirga xinjiangensis]|uniref:hypothetical protein n=1 Tax=Desertivirga xinjiangensis TaxID=539206 RepID=UPI00210D879C|nr:hypothetical protein [Pedobacter xinjiangensis]
MKGIINKVACVFLLGLVIMTSCKEEKELKPADTYTLGDFVYNLATKKFEPEAQLSGNIQSASGIKLVYYYLLRGEENPPVLVHTEEPAQENQFDYNFTIPNESFSAFDMKEATGVKVVLRHLDNTSSEDQFRISSFMPERPELSGFPAILTPVTTGGTTLVSGKIEAESGIAKIEIYDNYKGSFELVESITNLNGAKTYDLNYNYSYTKSASKLKIVVTDAIDIPEEVIVDLDVPYSYYKVFMTAHGTGTNTIFIPESGITLGNCSLNEAEAVMAFVYYATSNGPTFYSPTNTGNVSANFRCNGVSWTIQNPAAMRATKFRVLVQGTTGINNLYTQFDANTIANLDNAYFTANSISAATGVSARFDPASAGTTSVFNLTTASLIYVRIPDIGNPSTYKNALIKIREATSTGNTSTVQFEIMIQKK